MVYEPDEATPALLTAGIVMIGIGVMLSTFPAGTVLGVGVGVIGLVLFVVVAIRGWREWNRRPKRAPADLDPDRFWNAEVRLKSLMYASGGISIGAILVSLWSPSDARWTTLWVAVPICVASGIAFLLVRRHNRRKARQLPPAPVSHP